MGRDLMFNVAAFALQAGAIAVAAALLLHVLRIASAGTRYLCWRVALAACLVMPLALQRPAVPDPSQPLPEPPAAAVATANSVGAVVSGGDADPVSAPRQEVPWALIAGLAIAAGASARAAWLAIGLIRLGSLRRRGIAIEDAAYDDIQVTLGTRAALRTVEGLTQPATFGVWRPVVLLPDMLAEQPEALRRAVVTHELFHVQRRDWLWVLAEESIRTVLWFHPAILWLTSRIQLAREELVDELTVLATGNRKAYIEALVTFADAGPVSPAPAFARRRQLFTRIVRLSKEGVMSSPRIIVSAGFVIAAVLGTGWYASHAFPIVAAAGSLPTAAAVQDQAAVAVTADQRLWLNAPGQQAAGPARTAAVVEPPAGTSPARVAQGPRGGGAPRPGAAPAVAAPPGTKPISPENPIPRRLSSVAPQYPSQLIGSGFRGMVMLRVTLDASGAISDVQQVTSEAGGGEPDGRARAIEAFFTSAAAAVRQWRYQSPAEPPIAFYVRVNFEAGRDAVATQSEAAPAAFLTRTVTLNPNGSLLPEQVQELERRLALLRAQTEFAAGQNPPQDQRALEQQIQAVERELERARNLLPGTARVEFGGGTAGTRVRGPGTTAGQPVRVGGNIAPPAKTRNAAPVYPEVAKTARVQGVVIMEVTIDEQGRVAEARILRSIPLLDLAALDAVQQWEFTPTRLNGVAVPVIMTVTMQFTLTEPPPA